VFRLSRPALLFLLHSVMLNFALAVAALLYNLALARLGYDRYPIGLPLIGSLPLLGILNSLPVLSAGLSSLPIWALVTNRGPRAALILGALLHGIALVSVALRPEPLPLLFGAAVSGPASVLFQLSAAPLMMRASNDQTRDGLFSLNAGLNIAVFGLGSLLGGALPGMIAGSLGVAEQAPAAYRGAFALAAGCSLLAALPLWWLRLDLIQADATRADKQARTAENGVSTALAQLRRAPWATLRFLVAPLLISFGAALLIPYLNLYFQRRYGLPDIQIGAILALVNIVTGAATLAAPQLSRRLGKIGSVVLTQSLAVPCLIWLGVAPTAGLALLAALFRGALMNMAAPLYDAYAMERTAEPLRPTVIGLINGAFSAGYIVGPALSAQIQATAGFGPLFATTAVCYSLATIVTFLIFRK
jgi:predicted MFS family arabinose efflux permease